MTPWTVLAGATASLALSACGVSVNDDFRSQFLSVVYTLLVRHALWPVVDRVSRHWKPSVRQSAST